MLSLEVLTQADCSTIYNTSKVSRRWGASPSFSTLIPFFFRPTGRGLPLMRDRLNYTTEKIAVIIGSPISQRREQLERTHGHIKFSC